MNPILDPESLGIGGMVDLFSQPEAVDSAVDSDRPETDGGGARKVAEGDRVWLVGSCKSTCSTYPAL